MKLIRAPSRKEFAFLSSSRHRYSSRLIVMKAEALTVPCGKSALGLRVPKSVGNSVKRNLLRRRVRSIFAESSSKLQGSCAYLVILRPHPSDFYSLRKECFAGLESLNKLLRKEAP